MKIVLLQGSAANVNLVLWVPVIFEHLVLLLMTEIFGFLGVIPSLGTNRTPHIISPPQT